MTRGKWLAALCLVPFALFFIVFEIAPLAWVMINSLESEEFGWGLANFSKIFSSKFYLQAIQYSLEISFWSSLFGILISILGAYSLRKVDSRLRDFVNAFANMTSNFAGVPLAFAFIILLGFNGSITIMLKQAGIIQDFNLYSKTGLILLYTYFQIPLMIIIFLPAVDSIRPQWREATESLGGNTFQYWTRVAGPILAPRFISAFLLLFASAFSAYATAAALFSQRSILVPLMIQGAMRNEMDPNQQGFAQVLAFAMIVVVAVVMMISHAVEKRAGRWQ